MAEIMEWFQCRTCGRRQKWRAELVGTEIDCPCGSVIVCPDIDGFDLEPGTAQGRGDASGGSTAAGSMGGSVIVASQSEAAEMPIAAVAPARPITGAVPWHRHINFRALMWSAAALVGLAAAIFAVIMNEWPYWVTAGVVTPLTFWRWWKCERLWQGPRSLSRAVEETLGTE